MQHPQRQRRSVIPTVMNGGCSLSSIPFKPLVEAGPYSLSQFLPAGTLVLATHSTVSRCNHTDISNWHEWPGYEPLVNIINSQDHAHLRLLDFLSLHKFISATCRITAGTKFIARIYLIPFDLPNVEGRLRRRDEATVLHPARKYLRALLLRLTRDNESWSGIPEVATRLPFLAEEEDYRTLAEIYNTLPSPCIHHDLAGNPVYGILHGRGTISGMRTELYQYQRRSVAAMLDRELYPGTVPNPLFVPTCGVHNVADEGPFYLQPATMEILRERPSTGGVRGGILCEELGTGKTVMTLALIVGTLDQLSAPEESILDLRPVLSPLALRHFPSQDYVEAREKLARGKGKQRTRGVQGTGTRIPSLVEHLIHFCRTHPMGLELRNYESELEARSLWRPLQENNPFYYHYNDQPFEALRSSRKKQSKLGPKHMFLTSATLIVVPPNLFNQWVNEIHKHCDDNVTGRVYRATNAPLPAARELSSCYDIILMTHPRLSTESQKTVVDNQHTWKHCSCSQLPQSAVRIPDCRCNDEVEHVSPLLQIRWKRLIVDEGHVAGTTTTNLMGIIKIMSIERKWIVTGTPTTNLLGLHFGEGSELMYPDDPDEIPSTPTRDSERQAEFAVDIVDDKLMANIKSSEESSPSPSPRSCRVWTQGDRQDLHKMGNMITSFLELPMFATDQKLFSSHVIAPLMDVAGPRPGSVQVLTQVMQSLMIRHRTEDIEKDVLLPLMVQETVLLDLDPYALKTYNVMQANIVINAVDSERIDQDYFFHPRNATYLQQLIENISQAMFWHVDDDRLHVDEIKSRSAVHLARAAEKVARGTVPTQDLVLLQQALKHVESAANDAVWRSLMLHPYVCHRVYNMPDDVYQAWSVLSPRLSEVTDQQYRRPYHLMISDRLKTLRNLVIRRPLSQTPQMVEWGYAVSDEDQARLNWSTARVYASKAYKRHKEQRKDISPAAKIDHAAKLIAAQGKLKALTASEQGPQPHAIPTLLASSPLMGVRIGNSTSTKLDYILNEVRLYQAAEKFLVFSRSPLTLLYVAEGLMLMGIQYKLTSQKSIREVEQDVTTFESSDTFRVFLMELKHGARGLNLVTASRVIFCEPVWQADVESQAIKRVHRIGQASAVTVKTLAIRGTAEEVMVARRDALKRGLGNNSGRLPNLAEDGTMREFIANPTFLPESPAPAVVLNNFALLPESQKPPSSDGPRLTVRIPPLKSPVKRTRAVASAGGSDSSCASPGYVGTPPPSKKPRSGPSVRFADLP